MRQSLLGQRKGVHTEAFWRSVAGILEALERRIMLSHVPITISGFRNDFSIPDTHVGYGGHGNLEPFNTTAIDDPFRTVTIDGQVQDEIIVAWDFQDELNVTGMNLNFIEVGAFERTSNPDVLQLDTTFGGQGAGGKSGVPGYEIFNTDYLGVASGPILSLAIDSGGNIDIEFGNSWIGLMQLNSDGMVSTNFGDWIGLSNSGNGGLESFGGDGGEIITGVPSDGSSSYSGYSMVTDPFNPNDILVAGLTGTNSDDEPYIATVWAIQSNTDDPGDFDSTFNDGSFEYTLPQTSDAVGGNFDTDTQNGEFSLIAADQNIDVSDGGIKSVYLASPEANIFRLVEHADGDNETVELDSNFGYGGYVEADNSEGEAAGVSSPSFGAPFGLGAVDDDDVDGHVVDSDAVLGQQLEGDNWFGYQVTRVSSNSDFSWGPNGDGYEVINSYNISFVTEPTAAYPIPQEMNVDAATGDVAVTGNFFVNDPGTRIDGCGGAVISGSDGSLNYLGQDNGGQIQFPVFDNNDNVYLATMGPEFACPSIYDLNLSIYGSGSDDDLTLVGDPSGDTFYIEESSTSDTANIWVNIPITDSPTDVVSLNGINGIIINNSVYPSGDETIKFDSVNGPLENSSGVLPDGIELIEGYNNVNISVVNTASGGSDTVTAFGEGLIVDSMEIGPGSADATYTVNYTPGSGTSNNLSVIDEGTILTVPVAPSGGGIRSLTFSSLSVASGASLIFDTAAAHTDRTVVVASSLSVAGTLDLEGNDMVLHYGSSSSASSNYSAVWELLASGYASGEWNGAGIDSIDPLDSSLAANGDTSKALGVLRNNYGSGNYYSSFDGNSVGSGDILIKYTYYGDANLDGRVNSSDYTFIDSGYYGDLSGWQNGDFNYDGSVGAADYYLIDVNDGDGVGDPF